MRAVAGADEVFEEGEGRDRRAEDVQCEEGHHEPGGNAPRGLREDAVDGRGEGDQREEGCEPTDRLAGPVEDERAERGDERPERDSARFDESPEAPLEEEWKNEEHCKLTRAIG